MTKRPAWYTLGAVGGRKGYVMGQRVLVRRYVGFNRANILKRFREDAAVLAQKGYVPVTQQYVKGGCAKGCLYTFLTVGILSSDELHVTYRKVG